MCRYGYGCFRIQARVAGVPTLASALRAECRPCRAIMPRWLRCIGLCMAGLLAASICVAATPEPAKAGTAVSTVAPASSAYYVATSQLANPLQPFAHLPAHAAISVRTAVVTLPDPVETRLGRAFDIEMTSLISAFQASGYVLDGFAFSWKPRASDSSGDAASSTAESARTMPSVMLFRHDSWRDCVDAPAKPAACDTMYYALFLVGETPSFGIHPEAFKRAARCALALDDVNRTDHVGLPEALSRYDCDQAEVMRKDAQPTVWKCDLNLNVIGPAFSGAMESMAAALNKVAADVKAMACTTSTAPDLVPHSRLTIRLLTPSASVESNQNIDHHAYLLALDSDAFTIDLEYRRLAYSVGEQLSRVRRYLRTRLHSDDQVILLSEESSFGQGATASVKKSDATALAKKSGAMECQPKQKGQVPGAAVPVSDEACLNHIVSVQFPPNIAAIRSEHVKIKQDEDQQRRDLLPGRLLELDLTGVDKSVDQPPVYQASLSSRSDELMLFQTFDALNKYVHPKAAIIVATDVRDRLFMLSELRDAFPGALPIVLEQDNLLVHPDYRNTSRGSITMPSGKSVLCLQESGNLIPCLGTKQARAQAGGGPPKRYFAFATDYAANIFRAVVCLVHPPSPAGGPDNCAEDDDPPMLVATLAGFQYVDDGDPAATGVPKTQRELLIVSDTRIQLQHPVYLLMLLVLALLGTVVVWLIYNGRIAALVLLPINRQALRWMDLRVPSSASHAADASHQSVPGQSHAKMSLTERSGIMPTVIELRASLAWLLPWVTFALAGIVIAVYKIVSMFPPASPRDTDLAHGRDPWATICLCLAYACFAIFASLRMQVWNARCRTMAKHVYMESRLRVRLPQRGYVRALIAMVVLLVALLLCVDEYEPASVDNVWLSSFSGAFALGGSGFFLMLFLDGIDRWRSLSLELGKVVPSVRKAMHSPEWPSPSLLNERPRSPYNIVMRIDNYHALTRHSMAEWMDLTNNLLTKKSLDPLNSMSMRDWQAQLVAEMKVAGTAVRTSGLSSILGATVALMLIQVYTPVYERLQTMAATVLLACGVAGIVYAVLTLEKDFLLGRMFTNDKDGLTFVAALSALWPKLLGLAWILVTVFLPDAWDWLGGFVKAINSLH
jgi:hypothetical protein